MRRDLVLAGTLGIVLVASTPAFARVFADDGWRPRYLVAGVAALLIAAAVRRIGGNGLVSFVTTAVGLTMFTYVTALPDVGWLPDGSSLAAFRDLLESAAGDLREEIAPVVSTPGFTAAVATGSWLACHLAHELAVRFRRPGAGLAVITVLWALPLTVPMDDVAGALVRALPFLAAAGLVLLVGTEHGRGRGAEPPHAPISGLAVGVVALSLAALASTILPAYGAPAWVDLTGGQAPRGYQPIVDVTERLQLPGDRDVLRIRASERTYLRLAGLDSFDGGTWRLGPAGVGSYRPDASSLYRADAPLPPEEPARSSVATRVEVEVLDLANIYVPTPYQPVRVSGDLTDEMVWSTEGGFLATWSVVDGDGSGEPRVGVSEGASYAVDAERPAPDIEALRAVQVDEATRARWTALPREYPQLAEAAAAVYESAGATTDVDRALALQEWFTDTGRFTYDLDVPALRGDDALERFLLEDRVGYCEYFATGMAVMLRASGIPARVAVGFLPGTITDPADPEAGQPLTEYTVSTSDAHAWVEVLFPGYGWVTFEPTPRSDLSQIVPTAEDLAPVENLREQRQRELEEQNEGQADTPVDDIPDPVPTPQQPIPEGETGATPGGEEEPTTVWPWFVALAVGLVAIGTFVLRRRTTEQQRGPDERVLEAQRSLLSTGARYGVGRRPHETTRELVARWQVEGRVRDGDDFAAMAQSAAFGGDVDEAVAAEAERLVADLEQELRASVTSRDRLLAPVRIPLDRTADGVKRAGSALANRRTRQR